MSWLSRFANLFRRDRMSEEIAEEMASHLAEAVERGRNADDARRALGGALQYREQSREIRLLPWLDALWSDVIFGWRQIRKRPAVSITAVLSLALAMGATTSGFRIADALLFRALPVAAPERLFAMTTTYIDRNGRPDYHDEFDYSQYRQYRDAIADRAEVMAIGVSARSQESVMGSGSEMELVWRQYFSGNVFPSFGLHPAVGRLLVPDDDHASGSDSAAVLSYDFWTRRFAGDANVGGQAVRVKGSRFVIVGVAPKGFTGTEPGRPTDIFLAAVPGPSIDRPGWLDFQIWVRPKDGFSMEQIRQPLQALYSRQQQDRVKNLPSDTPRSIVDAYLHENVLLLSAVSGASDIQREYRAPLPIVALLIVLVLLIACANVGNLLTAQATSRAREMALRVSIGAGRWRLMQLALVESALLAAIASLLGTLFTWWMAPHTTSLLHVPGDPVRLDLSGGWRGVAFGAALTVMVTLLFGLAPTLQASRIQPMTTLRGGEERQSRPRLMKALLTAQMAFCILVLFVAGLFVSTFERLSHRPLGFSADHVLLMDASAPDEHALPIWMQVADRLHAMPGVRSAAISFFPILGDRMTMDVRLPGHPVETRAPYALDVSPGFFETMSIGLMDGRDFRVSDLPPRLGAQSQPLPGVGIVNEAFARVYFEGRNPVGRYVDVMQSKDVSAPMEIVGYVRDIAYRDLRDPFRPAFFIPLVRRSYNTILVKTAGDPLAIAPLLRGAVLDARPDFAVRNIRTQSVFLEWQVMRERLLAALSWFFGSVALLLAAIGLYGVLNYSVTQQTREVGIRMALGARPFQVVRRITAGAFAIVLLGLSIGLAGGVACGRLTESLLFEIHATSPEALTAPVLTLCVVALLAALFPALRAVRIDPAETLRCE